MRLPSLALILTALLVALACQKYDDLTKPRPGTVFVAARDTVFSPDTVTIALGLPIRWTNEGRIYHTVVSDSDLWASNLLPPRAWFEVTFDSAGVYPYHCSEHTGMAGTVIVQ